MLFGGNSCGQWVLSPSLRFSQTNAAGLVVPELQKEVLEQQKEHCYHSSTPWSVISLA